MARIKNPDSSGFFIFRSEYKSMAKTHQDVIEAFESRLLDAVMTCNKSELHVLLHSNFVFTNENGEVFNGIDSLQINEPKVLRFTSSDVKERTITLFDNIAVVISFENRTGTFRGLYFERQYRITRIWKFRPKGWKLINATVVLP